MADDVRVSDQEIAAVEREIQQKEGVERDKVWKEAEEKVKREMELAHKASDLERQKNELEVQLKKQQEETEKLRKESSTLLEKEVERRVADAVATRKSYVGNQNPFANQPKPPVTFDESQLQAISDSSYDAWMRRPSTPRKS